MGQVPHGVWFWNGDCLNIDAYEPDDSRPRGSSDVITELYENLYRIYCSDIVVSEDGRHISMVATAFLKATQNALSGSPLFSSTVAPL